MFDCFDSLRSQSKIWMNQRISSGEALTNQKKVHNGQICALIKINTRNLDDTQRKRLRFQTDAVSQIAASITRWGNYAYFAAEYLKLLILIFFHVRLQGNHQSKSDYEMTISTAVVETIVRPTITEQYLVITVEPKEALVTLTAIDHPDERQRYPPGPHRNPRM